MSDSCQTIRPTELFCVRILRIARIARQHARFGGVGCPYVFLCHNEHMYKRILIASSAIILLLSPLCTLAAGGKFQYAGWLPFWKKEAGVADISQNWGMLSEVSPFSYEVNANGTLVDKMKIHEAPWPEWLAEARKTKTKIIPSIAWFDGEEIHALLSNKKSRLAHEDAIAKLVKDEKFDGIDIDYEAKLAETKPYFSLLVEGLALRLHAQKKILSCTIEPRTPVASLYDTVPKNYQSQYANDYVALNRYCDEVRIMAYDQGTIDLKLDAQKGNGQLYAPVADIDWVKKVLGETMKTISKQKIVLGIPTYGYEYEVSWADGVATYRRLRSHTFFQAMNRADAIGLEPLRNSAGELGFLYATSTRTEGVSSALTWFVSSTLPSAIVSMNTTTSVARFVSFADAQSAAGEIALAKKLGLRGAAFFKLDGDQDPFLWQVMK